MNIIRPISIAPNQVDLSVTRQCNFDCPYCYADRRVPSSRHSEMTTPQVIGLLQEFASLGVLKVQISGGEPFIRPDIMEILSVCSNLPFATSLSSNGWYIDSRVARALGGYGLNLVSIHLDGPNSEIHDPSMGVCGSFARATRAICSLRSSGVRVGITCTLTKANVDYVLDTIDLAAELGAEVFGVQSACSVGRASMNDDVLLSYDRFCDFFLQITRKKKAWTQPMRIKLNVPNEAPCFWEYYFPLADSKNLSDLTDVWGMSNPEDMHSGISCNAGITLCAVDSFGEVYPCELFLSDPQMTLGNAVTSGFGAIWRSQTCFLAFRQLSKEAIDDPCRSCELTFCGAGCRASAYFATGSLTAAEPRCPLRKRSQNE